MNCNQSINIINQNNFSTTAKSITVYIMKFIALLSKSSQCCPNPGRASSSTTQQCFIVLVGESRNSLNRWKKSPSLFSKIEPYHFVFIYVEYWHVQMGEDERFNVFYLLCLSTSDQNYNYLVSFCAGQDKKVKGFEAPTYIFDGRKA